MHRAFLAPLNRTVAARNVGRNIRMSNIRPTMVGYPKMMRFASTNGAAEKEEPIQEKEEPVEEAKEVDPIEELKSNLTQKDKDLADMKNHYARAIADFRNLQESTKKEVQKAKDFALQKFAKDLLESLDNFALALNAVHEDSLKNNVEVKNLYEGVDMTRNIFERH